LLLSHYTVIIKSVPTRRTPYKLAKGAWTFLQLFPWQKSSHSF